MTLVYLLDCDPDDSRFGSLALLDEQRDARGYSLQKQILMAGNPITKDPDLSTRCPIGARYYPGRQRTDYPCIGHEAPAFSRRGFEALKDLLDGQGQILPLACEQGEFVGFRPTKYSDALWVERSDVDWMTPTMARRIKRYEFHPERLAGLSIFRIPVDLFGVYVTEPFARRVAECKLKGFVLRQVWPALATGTSAPPSAERTRAETQGRKSIARGSAISPFSEQPLRASTVTALRSSNEHGLRVLGLDGAAAPKAIVEAVDAFADGWQRGTRPPNKQLDPADAPYAMGSLWGQQLVREFRWEWAVVTFHDQGDAVALAVCSPDRSLAVYPIQFLSGCFQDPSVDVTVALSFNMLAGGKVGKLPPRGYLNLMDGVRRIVPRR